MPKATTKPTPLSSGGVPGPNSLKRNQACHQCRRRKLKCDAKRPICSTCARSHAYAVSHATPGAQLPTHPECTFDEKPVPAAPELPKSKYERLEARIAELEGLLNQKDRALMQSSQNTFTGAEFFQNQAFNDHVRDFPEFNMTGEMGSPFNGSSGSTSGPSSGPSTGNSPAFGGMDLTIANWPPELPPPDVLKHLVEVFFLFHPHAARLFHIGSFMACLALPPAHPKFPATPVLHAICAHGSLYTAAVTSPPQLDFSESSPDEIFPERLRLKEQRPDSFAERHAKLAREKAERSILLGENLLQTFQGLIVLGWFHWAHGRSVETCIVSAITTRLLITLGLNMCPPFHSITASERPSRLLPPARTVIEDEMRRNAFWLAYTIERQYLEPSGFTVLLADEEISQLLPVRGDQFEHGTLVPASERQWAHTRDVLVSHPQETTDSFVLYVKASILGSRIKAFNMRYRVKCFAGDSSVVNPATDGPDPDIRGSPGFIEMDSLLSSFNRASFPQHLRNPIVDNVVDAYLYTAFLIPLFATIILHEPHADIPRSGCISSVKILTAARGILDLIYDICSTSYDISLLDSFCPSCWYLSGRILVRFLQAALEHHKIDEVATLRTEIDFIHSAIARVGQRIPLAHKFAKRLENMVKKLSIATLDPSTIDFTNVEPSSVRPFTTTDVDGSGTIPHPHSLFL